MRRKADQSSDQNQTKFIGPILNPGQKYPDPAYPGPEQKNPDTTCPGMELARAYVPIQKLDQLYSPAQALETGTLFPELYRPYPY